MTSRKPRVNVDSAAEASADAELLEYLGSEDAEGQEWMEYLAHTDMRHVEKSKKQPVKAAREETGTR